MKYEIMYIVRPNVEESELKGIVKNFEEVLTKNGAKIESSKEISVYSQSKTCCRNITRCISKFRILG